jgi:hypothetical protein
LNPRIGWVSALDAAMIVLDSVVEIAIGPMAHTVAELVLEQFHAD